MEAGQFEEVQRELDESRLELEELRAALRRLSVGSDARRRDVERELHDGVQQRLVGLATDLELAMGSVDTDPAKAKELIAGLGRTLQQALEETRRLALRIYPPLLEAGGLRAALRSAAVEADVPTRIDVPVGSDHPPETASTVYFCYVEVLELVVPGTPVAVTVRHEGGSLAFEVIAERELDTGRLEARDRVAALGGRLTVRSGAGQTRVAGSVPLP